MLSSSSSSPTFSIPSPNDNYVFDALYNQLCCPRIYRSDTDSSSTTHLLMAEPFYPFQDPTPGPFEYHRQHFASHVSPSVDSDDHYQSPAFPQDFSQPSIWPTHATGSLHPNSASQKLHQYQQQQQPKQPHRRALSNSSIGSFAPDSPYSVASSLQYPAPLPSSNHQQPPWEDYSSPISSANHLPTPSHTPMRETFMDRTDGERKPSMTRREDPAAFGRSSTGNRNVNINHAGRQDWPASLQADTTADAPGETDSTSPAYFSQQDYLPSGDIVASRNIPKLDRTISDICQDELYNPSIVINSSQPLQHQQMNPSYLSPQSSTVNERVQAAQKARSASPFSTKREPSPFIQGSKLAQDGLAQYGDGMRTAAAIREQQKREADTLAYQQHHQPPNTTQPTTVSPKDAFPAQPEPEEPHLPSLFPPGSNQSAGTDTPSYGPHDGNLPSTAFSFAVPDSALNGCMSQPTPIDTQRSYQSQHLESDRGSGNIHGQQNYAPGFPPHLSSMESSKMEDEEKNSPPIKLEKPDHPNAATGTYSCTYHGCTQRFETPARLQKHKREGHRSTSSQAAEMTQAGPHRCTRTNPSTGKPCNTIFSRPYDLTRHEQSLHAPEKKKLRCPYCTEEKLFSRADALTRHSRVVHSTHAWPGKQRRRLMHQ